MDNIIEFDLSLDPFASFKDWYEQAKIHCKAGPEAMSLATSTKAGVPSVRVVLFKGMHNQGLKFFGHYDSQKGREMAENPNASVSFWWQELGKQIRITGSVKPLERKTVAEYFYSRDRASQIASYSSTQSSAISSRQALLENFEKNKKEFAEKEIPLKDSWGGWLLSPSSFEFFIYRKNRINDRFLYEKAHDNSNAWVIKRLQP